MRPDRILLQELRDASAFFYLRNVNTGHPGSLTTLHADSPRGAFERIALATLQAGLGLTKAEIMDYARFVVPIVVQLRRTPTPAPSTPRPCTGAGRRIGSRSSRCRAPLSITCSRSGSA